MAERVKDLCEKAIRNGDFTVHWHAKWGNPINGILEEDYYLTGNCKINTDSDRPRKNAVLRISRGDRPGWYNVEVWAYATCIATFALNADYEEAYIFDCCVTSRTDIAILRNVADMFGWNGVSSYIRTGMGWKNVGPMMYWDFKDTALYLGKYDLTPYC